MGAIRSSNPNTLVVSRLGDADIYDVPPPEWFLARIDGSTSADATTRIPHAWTQVTPKSDGSGYEDLPSGLVGTTSVYPAYAIRGTTATASGTVVFMRFMSIVAGAERYEFFPVPDASSSSSGSGGGSGGSGGSSGGSGGSGGSGSGGSGSGSGSGGTPWTSGNAYSYQAQIVEQVCPIYEDDPSIWNTDQAGGDVSGTFSNLSVIRLRGRGISTTAPTSGQALVWDGTNWTPTNISGVPVGAVCAFLNTVPSDWLELDGVNANRTTDANLFAYTGTLYGAGDGSTTFGIPDARGRTFIGAGAGSGLTLRTLAAALGSESVSLTSANNGSHTHGPSAGFTGFWLWNPAGPLTIAGGAGFNAQATGNTATASSGSGTAHENMQPSLVIRWAVKR